MDGQILARIILENQELVREKKLTERKYHIPETDNINVLIGIRRCGKTYTLYEIAKKHKSENVLFLDFEDERLVALNALKNYDVILESYKRVYPELKPILFFDEIQNLKNWHLFLRRLNIQGYKIFVTGSNANLLSSEIATYLKGHSIETKINTFSFPEFLILKNIEFKKKDFFINTAKIIHQFDEYMKFGSFPEVIKSNLIDKKAVSKNIYDLIFYKDLMAKYGKNPYLLKLIIAKIAENTTKEFSIGNLAKKIMPFVKTSIPTVTDYFNILPGPFLTKNIYQFRNSFVQRESKRKTYFADNSFILLNRIKEDNSRQFENLAFNHLDRVSQDIYYYKTQNNLEVDFYVKNNEGTYLVQASYSLYNLNTKEREIKSLLKAMSELNLPKGYIFTHNEEETIKIEDKTIEVLPLWKQLLQKNKTL